MNSSYMATLFLLLTFFINAASADIVVVVSSSSSIDSLTQKQVSSIFLGKKSTFPDGSKAVAIDQKDGSSDREDFYRKVTGKSGSQLKSYWSKLIFSGKGQPPKQLADADEVKTSLSSNPNQISYMAEDAVDASVKIVLKP